MKLTNSFLDPADDKILSKPLNSSIVEIGNRDKNDEPTT